MNTKRRNYTAPIGDDRCKHDAAVGRRGEKAQCMRRAVVGDYCRQHARMAERACDQLRAALAQVGAA